MITSQELIGRARELAPVFASRALEEEKLRAPSRETLEDLIQSGVLATLTPKVYGGHEFDLNTSGAIVSAIAAACPSTGWISTFFMGAAWRTLFFPEQCQREMFADKPYVLMAQTATPIAAKKVAGGYIINGQCAFSSGSVHSDWFSSAAIMREEGVPPEHFLFAVPREDVEILDNWQVAGMRGTASNDVCYNNIFVPQHRTATFGQAVLSTTPGQVAHSNPMYHMPFLPFAMSEVIPVIVGATRGAVTAFTERTLNRQGAYNPTKALSRQMAQIRLGRAIAAVDAAETLLHALHDWFKLPVDQQREFGNRVLAKARAAYTVDLCRNAINEMARGFGGDGFRDSSPLQRYFRDVNMLAVHAFLDIDTASESLGRLTLGVPVEDVLI